jgi:hypothetical protein
MGRRARRRMGLIEWEEEREEEKNEKKNASKNANKNGWGDKYEREEERANKNGWGDKYERAQARMDGWMDGWMDGKKTKEGETEMKQNLRNIFSKNARQLTTARSPFPTTPTPTPSTHLPVRAIVINIVGLIRLRLTSQPDLLWLYTRNNKDRCVGE